MPLVSVIMAVYNGERYLREAIDSLLAQTFDDFELIVIDDGSTDGTSALLAAYADPRLKVLTNGTNLGLTRSLNRGLAEASGCYVARQDADDVSMPERLERQVAFMENHSEVVVSGSAVVWMNEAGQLVGIEDEPPQSDAAIHWTLLLHNAFRHSTVIVRREVLVKHALRYDETARYAQDYDLWSRVARQGQTANLRERLVRMRNHPGSVTQTRPVEQQAIADRIAAANLTVAGLRLQPGEIHLMRQVPDGLSEQERTERAVCLLKLFRHAFPAGHGDVELRKIKGEFLWGVRQELQQVPLQRAALVAWWAYAVARMRGSIHR